MKNIGILLLINVVIVAGYFLFRTDTGYKRIIGFSGIGIFAALALIVGDRITGVKVPGIGEISAATERAVAGADRIQAIQKEVESQRDSIVLIVRDANKARDDITRIDGFATAAKVKTDELEKVVANATKAYSDLSKLSEFNLLIARANNDDRDAFNVLMGIANGSDEPFNSLALKSLINIATSVANVLQIGMADSDWVKLFPAFDRKKATIVEYKDFITNARPDIAVSALGEFWSQERFSKHDRLSLLDEILTNTKSIRALNTACRLLNNEAKINVNILAWGQYHEWWQSNSAKY